MLVEARDALFGYRGRPVVRAQHLRLYAGRCLGVFGPNGAGKSTLVRGLLGLRPPMSGSVTRQPARVGYVPQHRSMESHWPMTALDAASMAVSGHLRFGWLGGRSARVREAMRRLEVDHLAHHSFHKLSGGEQQRVLLAGAAASEPQVLALDEPTEGLDVRSRNMLLAVLRELSSDGVCTIVVSHDVEDLVALCDEVAWTHPADEPERPSRVELISPSDLSARVAGLRRST